MLDYYLDVVGVYREHVSKSLLWIAPGLIYFNREQVVWLIEHLDLIGAGKWPVPPAGNYIDPLCGVHSINRNAYYEIAIWYGGEIHKRLGKCGKDGVTLVEEIELGCRTTFSTAAESVLKYMIGKKIKKTPYSQWCASRDYYYKRIAK